MVKKHPKIVMFWANEGGTEPIVRWRLLNAKGDVLLPGKPNRNRAAALRDAIAVRDLLNVVFMMGSAYVEGPGEIEQQNPTQHHLDELL